MSEPTVQLAISETREGLYVDGELIIEDRVLSKGQVLRALEDRFAVRVLPTIYTSSMREDGRLPDWALDLERVVED